MPAMTITDSTTIKATLNTDQSSIHVSDRPDGRAITKANSAFTSASTNHIPSGNLTGKTVTDEGSYVIRIQNLISQILAQMNRIAEKDRTQLEAIKLKYQSETQQVANLMRESGRHGLKYSMVGFGASFLQFLIPNQIDRDIYNKFVNDCVPQVGKMFGSGIEANLSQKNNLSSLVLSEYQAKSQKGDSNTNSKQEVINLLEKTLESLRRAAQGS